MGIHLNDNGITKNNQLMLELMDILGLNIEDLPLSKNEYADFEAQINPDVKKKEKELKNQKRQDSIINWSRNRKMESIISTSKSSTYGGLDSTNLF